MFIQNKKYKKYVWFTLNCNINFSFYIKASYDFSVLDFWVPFWWQEILSWINSLFSTWYICIPPHNDSLSCLTICTYWIYFHNIGTIWNKNHPPMRPPELSSTLTPITRYTHTQSLNKKASINTWLWRWLHLFKYTTNTSCLYFIKYLVCITLKFICIIDLIWIYYFHIKGLFS